MSENGADMIELYIEELGDVSGGFRPGVPICTTGRTFEAEAIDISCTTRNFWEEGPQITTLAVGEECGWSLTAE